MRVYNLQVHTSDSEEYDDVYSFAHFCDLESEFNNKLHYYGTVCEKIVAKEDVKRDIETDEVHGMFVFQNHDGSTVKGKVYDYDVFD